MLLEKITGYQTELPDVHRFVGFSAHVRRSTHNLHTALAGLVTMCMFTSGLNSWVKKKNVCVYNDCICFLLFNYAAIIGALLLWI